MANRIEQARAAVDACIREAYLRAAAAGDLPEGADVRGSVEQPKDTANGDFAANHAMASAKTMHMAPRKIAEALIAHMELNGTWFASVEAAGPGFLNFRLSDKWYQDVLTAVDDAGADYGRVDDGHGEKVMVEFVSANPTGPMTIGNARGGVLGDALASVLDRAGYNVWREFYVNDAGNQVDLFGKSIEARYLQLIQGPTELKGMREQEVAAISRTLKATAKELNVPIIALSQLSRQAVTRQGGGGKPQLSDLRESGSIEQDADMVIFIHRPDYVGLSDNEGDKEKTQIIIAKHRNGETKDIDMLFKGEKLRFVELDDALDIRASSMPVESALNSSDYNEFE